jgi:hypothetical protein
MTQCWVLLYTVDSGINRIGRPSGVGDLIRALWGGLMKIIQDTEGVEVVNATSTSGIKETISSRESLPEEVEEPPRPWPHDGVVRSWAY